MTDETRRLRALAQRVADALPSQAVEEVVLTARTVTVEGLGCASGAA